MKGTFVFSLDTEIAWGWIGEKDSEDFYPLFERTREAIFRLIELFEKYDIPVTWAIVGRLIENPNNRKEPINTFYKNLKENDLYSDKRRNKNGNSYLYFPELVSIIKKSKVKHEIGSHSYSHITFGPLKRPIYATKEVARKDFLAAKETMKEHGEEITSFIYPQNAIGHQEILTEFGIKVYRGYDHKWYSRFPKMLAKICRQLDFFLPISPLSHTPVIHNDGVMETRGSLHFARLHKGFKKNVPFSVLEKKAKQGLRKAVKNKEVFHLWSHPFDLVHNIDDHFKTLESVLIEAVKLKEQNQLDICTMGNLELKYQHLNQKVIR